jgi:PAS domain S-box-containing protein
VPVVGGDGGPLLAVGSDAAPSSDVLEAEIVIDGIGVILRFSRGAEHVFGYSAVEVIGKNVALLMPEPYQSRHDQYLADYHRTGEGRVIGIGRRVTAIRKDGSDFPAHVSVTEFEFGDTKMFIGIVRDITAQVAAEAVNLARKAALDTAARELLELDNQRAVTELQYRLLADNGVDVVAHLRGREVSWISPSVEVAFGWPREHWIGADFTPHVNPEDLDTVATVLHEVSYGETATARVRLRTADGGYRWVEARGKPYLDGEGNTDGMIFAGRLIDEQVAAERQLKADRGRFEAVVANTPSAISVRDLQHRFTLVNEAFCQLFEQKSIEDVIGRTEDVVLPPDVLERSRLAAVRLFAGDNHVEEESINRRGESISVMTQRFSLRDAAGEIAELVTIRTDITHRKKIEQAAAERAMWDERIGAAISGGRLLVYSQPIVKIPTREVVDEELLVRLSVEGTEEILAPSEFLPQCEEHGLMPMIDRYMVGRAIHLACSGRSVSVNITGDTIGDSTAMTEILQALAAAGPDVANKIMFEITETTALDHENAELFSQRMRSAGCRMALDDFGTGYGTFRDLRHLNLDSLKIDRSFVKDMLVDHDDERVVRTICLVARTFGLTTIAEGVESEETLKRLSELGVDHAQGYLFGKPRPVLGPT